MHTSDPMQVPLGRDTEASSCGTMSKEDSWRVYIYINIYVFHLKKEENKKKGT